MEQPAMQLWELELEAMTKEQDDLLDQLWVDLGGEG